MNWLAKLLNRNIEPKSFVAPTPAELGGTSTRLPDPYGRNYYPYLKAYADKAWIYACVSVICDTVSQAKIRLRNEKGETVANHPALKLLERPNQYISGRNLRQWIIGSLELTGNAFILKDAEKMGVPQELFPLMTHLVEIVPGEDSSEPVKGYRYRAGGKTVFYRHEDVIHFRYLNPFDFFYGLAPLSAARYAADTLTAAEKYNRAFFDNSATISGILQTNQKLDDGTRARIMRAWMDKYQGETKAHKVALLEGGLSWQSIGMSQKDMDFVNGMKLNRETVLAIFHVPPAMVGIFENAPQYNTKEQQKIFWQTCIIPKANAILDTFNSFLMPVFSKRDKLKLELDISDVNALREDVEERSRAAKNYFDIGYSRDEITEALGLPFPKSSRKPEIIPDTDLTY